MRIGIFGDTYYPEKNGVAVSMFQLRKGLEALGHEVFIFTIDAPGAPEDDHVYRFKAVRSGLVKNRRVAIPHFRKWLRLVESLNLDVIHTQTEFTLGSLGRKAAKRLNLPLVHTYHTIYEHSAMYFNLPISGTALMVKIITAYSVRWCNRMDFLIVPTGKTFDLLKMEGVKTPIKTIPTGLDVDKYQTPHLAHTEALRKEMGLSEADKVLLYLGRVDPEKSIHVLVDHMKMVVPKDPHVKLVIVGGGMSADKLKAQVKSLGLEKNIFFTGAVRWDEVQDYYALGDIFVSASISETQGLTYYEALAAGLPVLAYRDRCLDEMVIDGENGYRFDAAEDFIDHLFEILDDHERYKANARAMAENFTAEKFGENVLAIYEQVLADRV
ncbi:MAG: glycosyltransferase [Lachnospiraceae bacterium]|nr:glycosyltransferase [Lachnospiraceae bacterium]